MHRRDRFPSRKRHRLTPGAYASSAYEYYFTVCARQQGQPFNNASLADEVVGSLIWTRNHYGWVLFCYCVMPDHLHFICRLPEKSCKLTNAGARGIVVDGVLEQLGRFKSYTTSQSWKLGLSGKLWQKSSYDRVFDLHRPFEEVAAYVLENPV
jgi:REP element-mobilizing transposase RayT